MKRAIIAFGANLGDPAETYSRAVERLTQTLGVSRVVPSPLYRTDPVGGPNAHLIYLNGAVLVETSISPIELYQELVDIQRRLGRTDREHWGPRPIDLDLVWMENTIVDSEKLIIPHPRMHYRWFVVRPAQDIVPDAVHPIFGLTMNQLFKRIVEPRPKIHFWGGSQHLVELARQELRSRQVQATTTHCPNPPQNITFQRLGESIVGLFDQSQAGAQAPPSTWQVVFDETEPSTDGDGSICPAVDARAPDEQTRLNNFKIFLDSLRAGSQFIPEE